MREKKKRLRSLFGKGRVGSRKKKCNETWKSRRFLSSITWRNYKMTQNDGQVFFSGSDYEK